MQAKKVSTSRERLLDPLAAEWEAIPGEAIKLAPTPLANQPSEYIKASRDETKIGRVRNLLVQAASDGKEVYFRLSWEDEDKDVELTDNDIFPDGAGILMPLNGGEPPIEEMGSREAPVNAWFWRADLGERGRNTVAQGLGTTRTTERSPIATRAAWGNGAWAVVFARPLKVPELKGEATELEAGRAVKVGFAVWEGSNGERAGVKSFSKEWRELVIEG